MEEDDGGTGESLVGLPNCANEDSEDLPVLGPFRERNLLQCRHFLWRLRHRKRLHG